MLSKNVITKIFALFFCGISIAQNDCAFKIIDISGDVLSNVKVYSENLKISKSDKLGMVYLNCNEFVELILIKAGYEELKIRKDEFNTEVVLLKAGIRNLDVVELLTLDENQVV